MKEFIKTVSPDYPVPVLEPDFIPAELWDRLYLKSVEDSGRGKEIALVLSRSEESITVLKTRIFDNPTEEEFSENIRHTERLLKAMQWIYGGSRFGIAGDHAVFKELHEIYSDHGARAFDYNIMNQIYGKFTVEELAEIPEPCEKTQKAGCHSNGCRIGLDLGGSSRKCVAMQDGNIVFKESLPWDPYFETDIRYHREKIRESIRHAAEHLPRVDAVGGSSAGVIIENQIRLSSLFRGIPQEKFHEQVFPIFEDLRKEMNIPVLFANDGEVTALAGALSCKVSGVLGISMGTSTAGGFVTQDGSITNWLNELAFIPVDYQEDATADEWSGGIGCGVQYFSLQAVSRLAEKAGITFPKDTPQKEQTHQILDMMEAGDARAEKIFRTIGVEFGYNLARMTRFYDYSHILLLGGVTYKTAGDVIKEESRKVLRTVFPEIKIDFLESAESDSKFGQAAAAATLPEI